MDLQGLLETPASLIFPAFNIACFLFAAAHGDTTDGDTLVRFGATERSRIWGRGESWRLLTCCFMHVGWIHLIVNTYFMFGWCRHVELELGSVPFALAYLMTGIGASAVSVLGHRAVSAGASGAGFGMIGVVLMIIYRHLGGWDEFFADSSVRYTLGQTAVWLVLGMFARGMDNWAHAGGLVFGLMAGYGLTLVSGSPDGLRLPVLIGVVVIWIAVVLASLSPRFARNSRDWDQPDF